MKEKSTDRTIGEFDIDFDGRKGMHYEYLIQKKIGTGGINKTTKVVAFRQTII